jgi:hypothetical protein
MPHIEHPTKPLADVALHPQPDGSNKVVACFMPDPDLLAGEGNSAAYLALDASLSLKEEYGGKGVFDDRPNHVQPVARLLGSILCEVSKSGKVSASYWAVSTDGSATEEIGEFDEEGWKSAEISGPKTEKWGRGTKLLPAIKEFYEKVGKSSEWSMGVFVTDGIIEDEKAAMDFCMELGRKVKSGEIKDLKMVLIGVGKAVDAEQLTRFDDMFEPTDLREDIDLWASGLAASMMNIEDIKGVLYGELMSEDTIIASSGRIIGGSGNELKSFSDGLPGKFNFVMPKGETSFTVEAGDRKVVQDCSEAI